MKLANDSKLIEQLSSLILHSTTVSFASYRNASLAAKLKPTSHTSLLSDFSCNTFKHHPIVWAKTSSQQFDGTERDCNPPRHKSSQPRGLHLCSRTPLVLIAFVKCPNQLLSTSELDIPSKSYDAKRCQKAAHRYAALYLHSMHTAGKQFFHELRTLLLTNASWT